MRPLISQKLLFYQGVKHGKNIFYCFLACRIYVRKKIRSLSRVLNCDKARRAFENTRDCQAPHVG